MGVLPTRQTRQLCKAGKQMKNHTQTIKEIYGVLDKIIISQISTRC